jgi:hypothetical protein
MATVYTFKKNGVAMRAPAQMTFALQKEEAQRGPYSAPRGTPLKPLQTGTA